MAIPATYPGYCDCCEQSIRVGDQIERDPVFRLWQHVTCPESGFDTWADDERHYQSGRLPEVCAECHMTTPCECSDA